MADLTEQKLIEIMQEEWSEKLRLLECGLDEFMGGGKDDSERKGIIGVDTKVRHKKSQLLYTVDKIESQRIFLRTPEGDVFPVSDEEFEENYQLD